MRIITANLNGIRSAASKGFFTWFTELQPDIVCLQETKAHRHQLNDPIFHPEGYHNYFFDAEKKGYSGVALYTRLQPDRVITGLNWHTADMEGRYLQADFGSLSVASLYLPSGTSGEERQAIKYQFLDFYREHLGSLSGNGREYIICGDFNIAHKQIDLKNWRSNQKNSGFLPEERAWLDELFDQAGFIDAFRLINQEPLQYTWWSNRGRARENNVGWRIDYQVITPGLKEAVKSALIYKEQRFSDHAPLLIEYEAEILTKLVQNKA
ncbi:MAG: exodeoxyribonuclease Xth [Gammaproteobacteria bacterium]|jgi:exodeoxyribonuclease-3|nr:exodeoxyribonuclease Xth [Gammaproteobacteria bacterium]